MLYERHLKYYKSVKYVIVLPCCIVTTLVLRNSGEG